MIEIIGGFLSGVVSGMGIGGGMLLIPILVFFLHLLQQDAQKINLIYFIPTAIIALVVHVRKGNVEYKKVGLIVISAIPSALIGAYLALRLDSQLMGNFFGVFLIIFGVKELYDGFTKSK